METIDSSSSPRKRSRSEYEDGSNKTGKDVKEFSVHEEGCALYSTSSYNLINPTESSEDDDIGPAMPSSAPKKKRRVLPYEKLYISALPSSPRYSKSLMHKDQLSFVTITPLTDFLITSSVDGVVKFWKKIAVGIESVKEFKAHVGEIRSVSVSQDGRNFATAGVDKTIKIFDVITFGTFSTFIIRQYANNYRSSCNTPIRENAKIDLLGTSKGSLITSFGCLR